LPSLTSSGNIRSTSGRGLRLLRLETPCLPSGCPCLIVRKKNTGDVRRPLLRGKDRSEMPGSSESGGAWPRPVLADSRDSPYSPKPAAANTGLLLGTTAHWLGCELILLAKKRQLSLRSKAVIHVCAADRAEICSCRCLHCKNRISPPVGGPQGKGIQRAVGCGRFGGGAAGTATLTPVPTRVDRATPLRP